MRLTACSKRPNHLPPLPVRQLDDPAAHGGGESPERSLVFKASSESRAGPGQALGGDAEELRSADRHHEGGEEVLVKGFRVREAQRTLNFPRRVFA